jgi:hypothetical protein
MNTPTPITRPDAADLDIINAAGEALARLWPHGSASIHVTRYPGGTSCLVNLHRDGDCYSGNGKTYTEAFGKAVAEHDAKSAKRHAKRIADARALLEREGITS